MSCRHACLVWLALLFAACLDRPDPPALAVDAEVHHVYPGQEIQPVLEAAAGDPRRKTVRVHAGVYRPAEPAQALIWFNERHDGITLEAEGEVVLTAANPDVADPADPGFPAIVSHVVYFGHGVTRATVLRGFRITGANGFVTFSETPGPIEPALGPDRRTPFFYLDGGGIKIYGRSFPTIEDVVIHDNRTGLCGGGVSVEHGGYRDSAVMFRNCIFRNNRCPSTGSALDLLPGSSAVIDNCLFVGNVGNTGIKDLMEKYGLDYNWEHGSGALTVFPQSTVEVRRSTFTGNWNGADDKGRANLYVDSIFWRNTASDGSRPLGPYELDIQDGSGVRGCFFNGERVDPQASVDATTNRLDAVDPEFDAEYAPRSPAYNGVGYRPVTKRPRR